MIKKGSLEFLRDSYVRMMRIREFETKATELTAGQNPAITGSIHPCVGQEAIPVGARSGLNDDDRVVATYRGHGWVLESGIDVYEAMAEMCQRSTGINGGRAGSLMISAPDRGFIGENSIVGAGGPIACGIALASRVQKEGKVVAVSFGDGATSQGGLHEAFVMAATLSLPVIFVCENNGWAEMSPSNLTVKASIADRGPLYGMAGEEVDGCDPEAVRDAVARAAKRAREGKGPTLLECHTTRLWGHYNKDIEHYRPKENRKEAEKRDPIVNVRQKLIAGGMSEGELAQIDQKVVKEVHEAADRAVNSPIPDVSTVTDNLYSEVSGARAEASPPSTETMTYAQAINTALRQEMSARPEVVIFGEDVATPGGVFGLSRGLLKEFGVDRVLDTPIAETSILGCAVGSAIDGLRPVAEIMFSDFLFVALDQLINQAANIRYVSNGRASAPLVVRTQQGVTPGSCAQHSQCVEAHLANVPGIKVGLPITPQDAYAMLKAAIADPDPCVIIEARIAFMSKGEVTLTDGIEAASGARLARNGADIGIISWGTSVLQAEAAAEELEKQGISAAVLDLRWLSPIDDDAIDELVRKCGRIAVVHEASLTGGFGSEIAARIHERHSQHLKLPVLRIGGLDIRMPSSPVLQQVAIPTALRISSEIKAMVSGQTDAAAETV